MVVPLLGQLEVRLVPPLGPRQDVTLAGLSIAVLGFGTLLVWQAGTVVHWERPASTLGVVMVLVGAWLMTRAADATQAAVRV